MLKSIVEKICLMMIGGACPIMANGMSFSKLEQESKEARNSPCVDQFGGFGQDLWKLAVCCRNFRKWWCIGLICCSVLCSGKIRRA